MNINKELDLAWDFVNNTNRNVFLTGKAGTGKTTFLHKLKSESLKRMIVVAPTGVAAINAKGVTIHSFFQMPFGPILPKERLQNSSNFNIKFSKTKINIIKSIDLLVIDEISMVRADLLDGIDKTLKRFRNKNLVFGGVQLLMIGDLQQLSPVIKDNELQLLKPFYKTIYFFSSLAYQKCNSITIELKHIYRQDNPKFIKILNEIRTNTLSQESANELNKRFIPDFLPNNIADYIFLTTHNAKAEHVNISELDKLNVESKTFLAKVEGKFPEFSFPNKEELVLKVGAQVMFIKNDSSNDKRYYNGKIGKVIFIDHDEVVVKCPDDDFDIIVSSEVWENINYTIDQDTNAITENKVGSYTQMPLRLAWSITIHKSQGLTFEKAIVDTQGAFAHGQTYVALSRCKSLEGLILKSKINSNQIINDSNIIKFNKLSEEKQPDELVLKQSKIEYQLSCISDVLDFYQFIYPIHRILDIYYNNKGSIEGNIDPTLHDLKSAVTKLLKIGHSFKVQLSKLSLHNEEPQNNMVLQERFLKALEFFKSESNEIIKTPYNALVINTDNKAIDSDMQKQLDYIDELLEVKTLYFNGFRKGFSVKEYLELRTKTIFIKKTKLKKQRKAILEGTTNVELFELLRELRNTIALREDLIHYQIFTQKALYAICETLPISKSDLKQIHGMGKTRVEKYGNEIIEVVRAYCKEHDIETSMRNEIFIDSKPKRKKGDTKKESLALFQSGKSIQDIADIRELTENTIFGHIASFIITGEVKITDLMSEKHYSELKKIIPQYSFENLSELKHQLDDKYSYNELRLVLNEMSK
ncbi:helix-turn-helix domain-containing protein [Psychroserpens sp. MEBiC05023]